MLHIVNKILTSWYNINDTGGMTYEKIKNI